jgi:hypothetical protein
VGPNHPRGPDVNKPPALDSDWQRLWFSTRQKPWTSLAIIPSDAGVDVGRVADALVAMGQLHHEKSVSLLNAKGVRVGNVQQLIDTLGAMTARGEWVIVPVDPIAENPSAVPVARATSGALLVVRLGESLLTSARSVIEIVGRDRLIGSIVLGRRKRTPGKLLEVTLGVLALVLWQRLPVL